MTELAKVPSGGNAPYKIVKQHGKWTVVNNIGETKATFGGDDAGYQKALAYQRALYVNVPGAAKRADKVHFTGHARRRGPAPRKEKSVEDQRTRIKAQLDGIAALPQHNYVPGVGGSCMSCGQPSEHPIHDDWTEGQQDAVSEADDGSAPVETSAYAGGGCMVALMLDPDEAKKFAGGNGPTEDPEDMHVTLAYMKVTPEGDELDRLKTVVASVARSHAPLDGKWGGTGKFNPTPGSDGKPVTVALPDLPGLPPLREHLVQALDAAGFPVSKDHGYTPHMTIAYADQEASAKGELDFDAITLAIGKDHFDYPLSAKPSETAGEVEIPVEYWEEAKDFSDDKRDGLASSGKALPDGSFPIESVADLKNAIQAVGRAKNPAAARRHIKKRARALGHPELIPDGWGAEKAHDTKVKRHRYVGAHHVRDTVVSTAGFFGGCYACGSTQGVGDHQGSCSDPGSAGTPPGGGSTPAEGAAADVEEAEFSVSDTIAAIDAGIDQVMVLLRSTPTEDLPPYAQQAKDLLGAVSLAIDGLMENLGIPDPDGADDLPDSNDLGPTEQPIKASLSEGDQKSVDAESARIAENKKTMAAQKPHGFRPARWTHPNGHPRCIVCGSEEREGGCVGLASEQAAFEDIMTSDTVTRERMATVEDAPATLPAVKAFLSEINGRTLITAPASTFLPPWEKALTPNEHFLWVQGKFVGAEEANRNGAFWSNKDLQMGEPTVKHGPLNWLHEDRHIIGSIADAKLVQPTSEAAAAGQGSHIAAVAAVWQWLYPDESFVIESASDAKSLFYSMECVSREVACEGPNGCGMVVPYRQMVQEPEKSCQHIRERSATRHFIDPTFLGGAVIVPPVRPGWAEANAQVMRQAASLAERAFDDAGQPDIPAATWERLMAEVVLYAGR